MKLKNNRLFEIFLEEMMITNMISMPETPIIVNEDEISKSYWFNGNSEDKSMPSIAFQKADFLDNYVERGITVLKFLRKQKWVDNSKLIVAGHSQGSKETLAKTGNISDESLSVKKIGYIIAGHSIHHINFIKEHYL